MNSVHRLPRPAILGLLALCAAVASQPATASYTWHMSVYKFPDFAIKSNGVEYTTMDGIGHAWTGSVFIDNYRTGRVKRWRLTPVLSAAPSGSGPGTPTLVLESYSASQSYSIGDRPKVVDKDVSMQFPPSAVAGFAKILCDENANRLRALGRSDHEIFAADHKLGFFVGETYDIDVTIGSPGTTEVPPAAAGESPQAPQPNAYVTCLRTKGSTIAAGNQSFGVENALESMEFHIGEESNLSGHCAVNLYGEFRTQQRNSRVDYHFVHRESGRRSAGYSLSTNASKRGDFTHRFDIPTGKNDDGTGTIALVVTNFDVSPSVMSYAMTCTQGGASGFAAELPPILSMDVKEKDTVMVDGQICPASVSLIAGIKARSDLEGKIIFVGSGYFSGPKPYQLANGHNRQFSETMDLKWETSGGFGSALTIGGDDQPKPLKSRRIDIGYNLVGANGEIAYQYERKSFQLACRYPQASPGIQAAGGLATGVHIHWARLTARPETALNGARCGVRIDGTLRANAANAAVSLEVRDERGATLARHTVTTDSQKQAHVRDFIGLADAGPDGIGSLSANVSNTDERNGALRLVGTSVEFESNAAPFRLTCRDPAPGGLVANPVQPGSAVPTIGALTMRPKQPLPRAALAAEVKGVTLKPGGEPPAGVFGAKQMKPRDDKDEPTTKTVGAMSAKPAKARSDGKAPQVSLQATAVKLRRADAAVTKASIAVQGQVGTVQAKVANRGDADMRGALVIRIKNGRGRTVANMTEPLSLKAGDSRAIQKRFKVGGARTFVADVSVRTANDADMRNNRKQARVSR